MPERSRTATLNRAQERSEEAPSDAGNPGNPGVVHVLGWSQARPHDRYQRTGIMNPSPIGQRSVRRSVRRKGRLNVRPAITSLEQRFPAGSLLSLLGSADGNPGGRLYPSQDGHPTRSIMQAAAGAPHGHTAEARAPGRPQAHRADSASRREKMGGTSTASWWPGRTSPWPPSRAGRPAGRQPTRSGFRRPPEVATWAPPAVQRMGRVYPRRRRLRRRFVPPSDYSRRPPGPTRLAARRSSSLSRPVSGRPGRAPGPPGVTRDTRRKTPPPSRPPTRLHPGEPLAPARVKSSRPQPRQSSVASRVRPRADRPASGSTTPTSAGGESSRSAVPSRAREASARDRPCCGKATHSWSGWTDRSSSPRTPAPSSSPTPT